jgi:3-methyladenine DNA glycosylase AlkD
MHDDASATAARLVDELRAQGSAENVAGMARFGTSSADTLGVPMPVVRRTARAHKRDHELALALWDTGVHEARILSALVDDPKAVAEAQLEAWVRDLDSWDVCDQLVMNLVDKTPFAWTKVYEWAARDEEFVKRAGFALMASLASHDKKAADDAFLGLLPVIAEGATDGRNFVKKAVNWALRGIGKRDAALNTAALTLAEELAASASSPARWVAKDASRELRSDAVRARLGLGPAS